MNTSLKIISALSFVALLSSCDKNKNNTTPAEVGQQMKIKILSHAISTETTFSGAANALEPNTSKYIDVKVNGTTKGTQATILNSDLSTGELTVESAALSKLLTVSYTIQPNENTMYTVYLYADGEMKSMESIAVDSGVIKSGTLQLIADK